MVSGKSPIWGIREDLHNLTSRTQILQNSLFIHLPIKKINSTQTCCGDKLLSQIVFTKKKKKKKSHFEKKLKLKNSLSSLPTYLPM